MVVGSVVGVWRLPALARGTVWAEDGSIFLAEFLDDGWSTLLRPYAGYLHLGPRLVVGVVAQVVPLSGYAMGVTVLTCVVAGMVGAVTFLASRQVMSSMFLRVVVGMVPVLSPLLPLEVSGNAANLHWVLLWVVPWLLVLRPRRWLTAMVCAGIVLVAALSEIQAVFFLPLLPVLWQRARPMSVPPSVGLVVGVVAQLAATVLYPREPRHSGLTVLDLMAVTLANSGMGVYTSDPHVVATVLVSSGWLVPVVGAVPFAAGLGVVVWRLVHRPKQVTNGQLSGLRRRQWLLMSITCAVMGVSLLGVAVTITPGRVYEMAHFSTEELASFQFSRYAVLPAMFLVALIVLVADYLIATHKKTGVKAVAIVVVVGMLAAEALSFFPVKTPRSNGPAWSLAVAKATAQCRTNPKGTATLPLAPNKWKVKLPCIHLLS
jgi:hypothetical protein